MSNTTPKAAGMVTLRYVVMSVLNRLQDYSMKQYMRLMQIGIECFQEDLAMYHIDAGIDVVYLHMSTAKTVALPSDFIDYRKIGYPRNGKLQVITKNDNILLPRVFDDTGEYVGNLTYSGVAIGAGELSGIVFYQDHYRNGQFVGGLYGVPGGVDISSFRIDKENRQIIFSDDTPRSEVVMEYVTNGLKTDGSSLIPREVVPALRNYILWQKDECDPRVAYNAKERLKREYDQSIEALRSFENMFTAQEYRQMVYSTYTQSPKR